MNSQAIAFALIASLLATITMLAPAAASGEEHRSDAEHCLSLSTIDRTDVVSDQGILFYTKSGDIYLNKLPHRCPGLAFEESFMYRTSVGQLCDLDIITVLDDIGFGLTSGVSCGLGQFHPVSEEEVKTIRAESPGH